MRPKTPTIQSTAPVGFAVVLRGLVSFGVGVLVVVSNKIFLSPGLAIGPQFVVDGQQGSIG